jgi:putative PEP-CTERM system TPR-repeat lipoprotein
LAKNDFGKATAHFERAADISPDSETIRTQLGISRLAQGDNRAMADLQAAAEMEDSNTRADNVIILNKLKKKQFDAALVSIDALERKQPKSPLSWNYRGAAYAGKKDAAKARSSFEQALKLDPKFFPAVLNLTQLDLNEGKADQARKRFENILNAEPRHLQAMIALADLSRIAKDEKAYRSWLEKAAASHPRAIPPRAALARHYLSRKEPQKALALARETVSANPDNPEALNLLGTTQLAAGDTVNAIATFTRLTEKARQSPNAFVQLARVQLAAKNTTAARTALQKALQLQPDHMPSLEALLRLEIA